VDGSEDRGLDQPGVGQSHEVVVAVDEVELSSALERLGDVKVFGYFGIDGGILFIPLVHHGMQVSAGYRIPAREQRHIPATGDEPFGDVASHRFPGAVLPRRRSPGYRRQDCHSFFGLSHTVR
jgi:hypothetical protein